MPRETTEETRPGTAAGTPGPPKRDGANTLVLEVVIAAVVLAGAAVVLAATMGSGPSPDRTEGQDLRELSRDTLRVLAVTEGNESRRTPLEPLVADAIHGRSGELANRTARILPEGAGSRLYLSNGEAEKILTPERSPPNGSVTAQQPFAPGWPTLHVVPDLRVYPTDTPVDMNVTALPLWNSNPVDQEDLDATNLSFPNGFQAPLEADGHVPGTVANTSVPNATQAGEDGYPLEDLANLTSNATYRGSDLEGEAPYRTDGANVVNTTYDPVVANLTEATLSASPDDVAVGDSTTISWDLTPVSDAVQDHTNTDPSPEVHLTLYRPIPRDNPALPAHPGALDYPGLAEQGSLDVPVDEDAVVGRWMVLAQLNVTLESDAGTVNQSARVVDTLTVRPPGTQGDPQALYGLEMVAWYDDW